MSQPDIRSLREKAFLVQQELVKRQSGDPWWNFVPHSKQLPFIKSILCDEVPEAWFIAANRSGKTDAACHIGAGLARFGRKNPRYQITHGGQMVVEDYATSGMVVSVDFPNSRDVVQPKYFNNGFGKQDRPPFIPEHELKGGSVSEAFSVTNQILRLKNGSLIAFKSSDNPAIKIAGQERDWVQFDEEPKKTVYDEAVIRVGAGKRLLVFGACTLLPPEGQVGGVSWMFPEKIKPWQEGKAVGYRIFRSSIYDNPHLLPSEIQRLESIYAPGSAQRAIRLEGELMPGIGGSRAYTNFDSMIHVRAQGEFIHRRPICWVWDFNVEPMVSLVGQREGNLFRFHKELILDEGNIDEMCQMFTEYVPYHTGEIWVYGDATGTHRHASTGRNEYQLIANYMRAHRCSVRIKVKETNPLVSDRVNSFNYALRNEHGESHVEIDPSCEELIADMEQVLRDHKNGIKKTHNRRDPYIRRTHTSDAAGYWITYEAPIAAQTFGEKVKVIIKNPGYAFKSLINAH